MFCSNSNLPTKQNHTGRLRFDMMAHEVCTFRFQSQGKPSHGSMMVYGMGDDISEARTSPKSWRHPSTWEALSPALQRQPPPTAARKNEASSDLHATSKTSSRRPHLTVQGLQILVKG